jgi:hypothetical protein
LEPLIDTQEFLALSSFLNYQLCGEPVNWRGILDLMAPMQTNAEQQEVLIDALKYLGEAYGSQKRRLGPLAILHPIRATALFTKAQKQPAMLDLLTVLLHDKNEDITPDHYGKESWVALNDKFSAFLDKLAAGDRELLNQRVNYLTKTAGQKYYVYLDLLFEQARHFPELAAIKLADRLDNTLDLRIDLHDFTDNSRCYQVLFDILFLRTSNAFITNQPHPISRKINGAMRLYQLYKNAVFLSLLRHKKVPLSTAAFRLFSSLAVASIREAQTIILHIFAFHLKEVEQQRQLLLDVLQYSRQGGFEQISSGQGKHDLDGLFKNHFEFENRKAKQEKLDSLYSNKRLMGQAALGFIVIFANFINDDEFLIRGITADGIIPQI